MRSCATIPVTGGPDSRPVSISAPLLSLQQIYILTLMTRRFTSARGPSQRQLRAGELIRHALVEIFQRGDFREPALQGVSITISEVRVSPDLKNASVYAAPLGGGAQKAVIEGLNHAAAHIRGLLGKKIELKFTPALRFHSDETFAEAQKIEEILSRPEVARDLEDE